MQSLIFLTTLLSTILVSTSSPVLDFRGNPVTTDFDYTIEKDGYGFLGGLVLQPINDSCARYAAYSNIEVQRGISVRFHPFIPSNSLETGHGFRFKIEFMSTPRCVETGVWGLDSTYVVAGGKEGSEEESFFAVLEEEDGKYTLAACGACALCKNLCTPLGTEGPFLKTDGEFPLKVYFAKSYCAEREDRAIL